MTAEPHLDGSFGPRTEREQLLLLSQDMRTLVAGFNAMRSEVTTAIARIEADQKKLAADLQDFHQFRQSTNGSVMSLNSRIASYEAGRLDLESKLRMVSDSIDAQLQKIGNRIDGQLTAMREHNDTQLAALRADVDALKDAQTIDGDDGKPLSIREAFIVLRRRLFLISAALGVLAPIVWFVVNRFLGSLLP